MKLLKTISVMVLAAVASLAGQGPSQAQSPEEFYKGKTVSVLVSAAGGTASDTGARALLEQLKKYFPGNPNFAVFNVEGAGGLLAASRLQTSSAKDGTVIALLQRNNLYMPRVTNKEAQFDPRKVIWVGSIDGGEYPNAIVAFEHSPVQSAEEMFTKTMIVGATSFTNENRAIPAMMNAYFGTKFKIVPGYQSLGEIQLAMERGEVHARMQAYSTLATPQGGEDYVKAGKMKPIVTIGLERSKAYPDLPSLADYLKTDQQRAVARFFMAGLAAGRPFAVPSGVPADRVAAIRKAFADTFKDPEAVKAIEVKSNLDSVAFITGEKLEGIVEDIYAVDEKTLEGVRGILIERK
jgi:tripartite-type tricarboxylate transporter receptor subunit TctC